ncbi:MAG: FtsH protease activity modulator HflK [bacterium]|nr:FtsH protease activity modulator HflK [bacterium]
MDIRRRAAGIATIVSVLLTLLKFTLYSFTGSLVILAEAWHSFSDIATSLLLFVALSRGAGTAPPAGAPTGRLRVRPELLVSFGIGGFLFCVAVALIRRALTGAAVPVQNPTLSGVLFICFAIGSSFLSRFETGVGIRHHSIGLVSDGMHSRADMVASLLAGVSLILYGLGIDIDRWMALAISLFILSLSIEVMVNAASLRLRGDDGAAFRFRSYRILLALADREAVAGALRRLDAALGGHIGRSAAFRRLFRGACRAVPLLLLAAYLSTCLHAVGPSERAVRLRFGRPVAEVGPGLHLKRPWPVDRVIRRDASAVKRLPIGNLLDTQSTALLWTRVHGTEEAFLSGDNNYVFPYLTVHYRIKDLRAHLFRVEDPVGLCRDLAHARLLRFFAAQSFYELATSDRPRLCETFMAGLQEDLDRFGAGIEVVAVNIRDMHPPVPIAGSFEEVIAAIQAKQQIVNEALAYRNKAIPEARGESARTVNEASAYVIEKVAHAKGDAARFAMRLDAHGLDPAVSYRQIYFASMRSALPRARKIVFDPRAGSPSLYLESGEGGAGAWFTEVVEP